MTFVPVGPVASPVRRVAFACPASVAVCRNIAVAGQQASGHGPFDLAARIPPGLTFPELPELKLRLKGIEKGKGRGG